MESIVQILHDGRKNDGTKYYIVKYSSGDLGFLKYPILNADPLLLYYHQNKDLGSVDDNLKPFMSNNIIRILDHKQTNNEPFYRVEFGCGNTEWINYSKMRDADSLIVRYIHKGLNVFKDDEIARHSTIVNDFINPIQPNGFTAFFTNMWHKYDK